MSAARRWRIASLCMTGKVFVDSNIFIYAHDIDGGLKRQRVPERLTEMAGTRGTCEHAGKRRRQNRESISVIDCQRRSSTIAIPCPTPIHIVQSAYLPPVLCN